MMMFKETKFFFTSRLSILSSFDAHYILKRQSHTQECDLLRMHQGLISINEHPNGIYVRQCGIMAMIKPDPHTRMNI